MLFRSIVYVKHYLTPAGIEFFKTTWFPKVLAFMREHAGYLSCTYTITQDCVDITIQFQDEPSFDAYVNNPSHHQLPKMLDPYRSRNYWKAVRTLHPVDSDSLQWTQIDPSHY